VFAIILIFLSFFSTFLFQVKYNNIGYVSLAYLIFFLQAGLLSDVLREFGASIFISALYLILSVALHWVTLQESTTSEDWSEEEQITRSLVTIEERWPPGRLPLYAAQRFCSKITKISSFLVIVIFVLFQALSFTITHTSPRC